SFAPIPCRADGSVASFVAFLLVHGPCRLPFWQDWVRSSRFAPRSTDLSAALASFARLSTRRTRPRFDNRPETDMHDSLLIRMRRPRGAGANHQIMRARFGASVFANAMGVAACCNRRHGACNVFSGAIVLFLQSS